MAQIYENQRAFHYKYPENHPIVSLIYLLLFVIVGAFVFSLLGMGIGFAMHGMDIMRDLPEIMSGSSQEGVLFLKIFQMVSSIGVFVVPSLLLRGFERRRSFYYDFSGPKVRNLIWLTIGIMLAAGPVIEVSGYLNQQMKLPESLANMEAWMEAKELEMKTITEKMLVGTSFSDLLLNLLVVAVVPAIGEELLFRGSLQPILTRWFKNYHVAIWATAIIFSAIHVQFYGFIPRLLMGAAFGYLFYWSKSIWLPILAHFLNNGTAVVLYFIGQKQGKSFDEISEPDMSYWPVSIIAAGVLIYLFILFKKMSKDEKIAHESLAQQR